LFHVGTFHVGLDVRIAPTPNGVDPTDHLAHGASPHPCCDAGSLPLRTVQVDGPMAAQGERMHWVDP
jgi:hypothetical protein